MSRFSSKVCAKVGLPLCAVLLISGSCSENIPTQSRQTFSPEVRDLIFPAVVYALSARKHTISVRVVDPQGLDDVQAVSYSLQKSNALVVVANGVLSDDGQGGDILPNDGVFSAQVDGSFAQNDSGDFDLEVIALDLAGNESAPLQATILVSRGEENLPPQIDSVSAPKSVPFDSTFSFVVSAQVSDPEGLADVASVKYGFFPPTHATPVLEALLEDGGQGADQFPDDGIFSASVSSELVEKAADYFIRVQAEDKSGNSSKPIVVVIQGRLKIDAAPFFERIEAPDIVNINANNQVLVRADVNDPDGLADVDTVRFKSFLPDGQETPNSPLQMFDDGNPGSGDLVAGDGTFSAILPLTNETGDPLELKLQFQAKDRSGILSNPVEHILTVALDDAPVISNLVAPDQAQINPQQPVRLLITLDVKDPQGLADIALAQFRSFLPDGEEANNSPLQLFDDGRVDENGDQVAGDGTYSLIIVLPSQGVTPGDFRFDFMARDLSGLESNVISHTLTVTN